MLDFKARWELIEVSEEILTPRSFTVVASLNNTEIAILGGIVKAGFNDFVVVFNTETKQFKKVRTADYMFSA